MNPKQGEGEQRLGHEVPVTHRVQRILKPGSEAQVGRHAVGPDHAAREEADGSLRTPGVGLQFTDPTLTAPLARELEDYAG